jgi:hypothetical protein
LMNAILCCRTSPSTTFSLSSETDVVPTTSEDFFFFQFFPFPFDSCF